MNDLLTRAGAIVAARHVDERPRIAEAKALYRRLMLDPASAEPGDDERLADAIQLLGLTPGELKSDSDVIQLAGRIQAQIDALTPGVLAQREAVAAAQRAVDASKPLSQFLTDRQNAAGARQKLQEKIDQLNELAGEGERLRQQLAQAKSRAPRIFFNPH